MFKFKRRDGKIVLPRRWARDLPGDEGVCRGYAVSKLEEYVTALEQLVSTLASKSQTRVDAVADQVAAVRHAAENSQQLPCGEHCANNREGYGHAFTADGTRYDLESIQYCLNREDDLPGAAVDGQD